MSRVCVDPNLKGMSLCRVQSGFKLEPAVIQNKIVVANVLSQSAGEFVSVIYHYHDSLRAFDSLHMVYDTLVRDIPTIHVLWPERVRSFQKSPT